MTHAEAVKVTVIVEQDNGDTITVISDNFEYLELGNDPVERPMAWDFSPLSVALPSKRNLTFEIHGADQPSIVWRQYVPPIDDPTVVETDSDGR